MAEQHEFKAEVQQLLNLVIHSLYSKKEIFLRELISNASDAIDRCRLEALTNKELIEGDPDWEIRLDVDPEAKTLSVTDNGIGMNAEEVEANIGTIANSGTKAFLAEVQKGNVAPDAELIGQFGVGFYAAFMVADKVTLVTRRADGDTALRWESAGDGSYTLEESTREGRGTTVTLHLREDQEEFLEEWRLRRIVKQYSDYVAYPVRMAVTRDEIPTDEEGQPIEGAEPEQKTHIETLNSMKALWKRPKGEIQQQEYFDFYKGLTHDYSDPLEVIHYHAEAPTEFRALLYLPGKVPFDLFLAENRHKSVHLYVRNVFITDECRELMPEYLRFVKGVVDSADLPLNVSREMLQDDAIIRRINKSVVGRVLKTLAEMQQKNREKYTKFYREFGKVLKEGLHFDFEHKEQLQELVMFESTTTAQGEFRTLKEYVAAMPEAQPAIYFLAGDSRETVARSPYLEALRGKGFEVLFLIDPIDEWVTQSLTEYDGKKLVAVDRGELELDADDAEQRKQAREEAQKSHGDLLTHIQQQLDDKVKEVRFSDRLTDSACCLVADEFGMNAHMERIFRAMNQEVQPTKRILELNPSHPILKLLQSLYQKDPGGERLRTYVSLLHDQALLNEGSQIADPLGFAQAVTRLMLEAGGQPPVAAPLQHAPDEPLTEDEQRAIADEAASRAGDSDEATGGAETD